MKKIVKKLDKVYLSPNMVGIDRYVSTFKNYHSRCYHSSWLLLEDLNKSLTYKEVEYTIFGMWDNESSENVIMLKPKTKGAYLLVNSKKVAQALGYHKMRNLATHETRPYGIEDVVLKANSDQLETMEEEETLEEDFTENEVETDNIYQDLIDDIIDEGDSASF
jgi:hypothetical protein